MTQESSITKERVQILYGNAFAGNVIVVLSILVLNYIYIYQIPIQLLIGWDIYMLSISLLRLGFLHNYRKHSDAGKSHEKYEQRYTYATGFVGLGWAFFIYIGLNQPLVEYQFYSLLVLAGIVAIAAPLFTSSIQALYFYILPSAIIAIPTLLLQGGNHSAIGLIMIFYTLMVLRSSHKIYNTIIHTLILKNKTLTLSENLKLIDQEKSNTEKRMQGIVDYSSAAIYVNDLDGRFTFLNQKVADLHKMQRGDVIGKTIFDILPKDIAEKIHQNDLEVIQGNHSIEFQECIPQKDGPHYFISTKFPLFDENNKIYAVGGVSTDITERVKTEESLHISQRRLLLHRQQSPVGIIEWNVNFEITDWNPAAEKIFGFTKEEVIGKHITERILTQHSHSTVTKNWTDSLINKDGTYNIIKNVTKDGRSILCEWHNTPLIDDSGEIIAITSIVEDITERHKNEENLRHTQKMDAIGKLTGGIAHDFNNMLGVIIGFSELLKERAGVHDEKIIQYSELILNSADRAKNLTAKLLNFSRKIPSSSELTSLNLLLDDMQSLLEKSLTPRIDIHVIKGSNIWSVWLDKTRLEDAILNICINSMHAMPEGGKLTITTSNTILSKNDTLNLNIPEGEYVLLTLEDTGTGIEPHIINKIFDPFFTTKGTKGTGLGLSQVYGFIKQSNGAIQVVSQPNQGTCLTLYFPRAKYADNHSQLNSDSAINTIPGGHETILVVDDEPSLLTLSKEILEVYGYVVLCAENAEKAQAIINSHHIDLLLSDVIMPGIDGYQLANIISKSHPNIKIQIVSGFNDGEKFPHANPYLSANQIIKPYTPDVLLRRVRKLLDENSLI